MKERNKTVTTTFKKGKSNAALEKADECERNTKIVFDCGYG